MSTFLFASIPVPAHTSNPLPIAARLVERGHRVRWYAGAAFHPQIAAVGAEPLPYVRADDFGGQDMTEHFPWLAGLSPLRALRQAFAEIFVGQARYRVPDLREIVAAERVDAMLCDELMVGVGQVGELDGIPWATFGDGPLAVEEPGIPPFGPGLTPMRGPVGWMRDAVVRAVARRIVFADADREYRSIRADLDLPATENFVLSEMTSPMLHMQGCTPGFEYPRRRLPAHVHWVGALRPDPPPSWDPPAWWAEVTESQRPVVAVSQGSIRPDVTELLVPAVRGLAGTDALVVVTTGQAEPDTLVDALGGAVPDNVRITRFIPYGELFRHASVFVTNGGYSGVTLALAYGIPLVQAGRTEEKAEIEARIKYSGTGVTLGSTRPTARAVADGVARALDDSSYRLAAQRVRDEMAAHDAGREGADLLERLAATGRPVLRTDAQPAAARVR